MRVTHSRLVFALLLLAFVPAPSSSTWGQAVPAPVHHYQALRGLPVTDVRTYGAKGDGVADDTVAIRAAMTAAGTGIVSLPPGTYLTSGLSLSGQSCSIRGAGDATILKAKAGIAGPVLDLTGYHSPTNTIGRRYIGDFTITGSGEANTAGVGIKIEHVTGISFKSITISNTGGIGLTAHNMQFCDLRDITILKPVSANANNVSYAVFTGASNANLIENLLIRSIDRNPDCACGCVIFKDDGSFAPEYNTILAFRTEYQHIPSGGTVMILKTNGMSIIDSVDEDVSAVSGATNTAFFRLQNPAGVSNSGGNTIRGIIPGYDGTATSLLRGVVVEQSYNRIEGIKGYNGSNVELRSGVGYTSVLLGGSVSRSTNAAVVDNSGQATNVVVDCTNRKLQLGGANLYNPTGATLQTDGNLAIGGTLTAGAVNFDGITAAKLNCVSGIFVGATGGGNLLSANQADVEQDSSGLQLNDHCTFARTTAQAAHGSASLQLTSTTSTSYMGVITNPRPAVSPGVLYRALCSFRAAATPRTVWLEIFWYDGSGQLIGGSSSAKTARDTTTGWTQVSVQGTAPPSAVSAFVAPEVGDLPGDVLTVGEVHYIDMLSLSSDPSLMWQLPGVTDGVTIGSSGLTRSGTGTDLPIDVNSKGAATTRLNVTPGTGTGGVQFGDGAGNVVGRFGADGHLALLKGTPTIAAGTSAGTAPTVAITGSDQSGVLTVTTGTGPAGAATVSTVTFGRPFATAPRAVIVTPAEGNAAALSGASQVYVDAASTSTTQWVLKVGARGLQMGTTYKWHYHIDG